jgi:uncharacterized protein
MFVVFTFVHRKLDLWHQHLERHVAWLHQHTEAGVIRATGPFTDTDNTHERAAMIVIQAPDERSAHAVLDTDPFVIHDVTEDLVIRTWNPFIGVFADDTAPPPQPT